MSSRILIVGLVLFFVSCRKQDKVPADILPLPQMRAMLWDMMRADKLATDFMLVGDTSLKRDSASIHLYQQVLAIHSVSKEKFRESFNWYKQHPAVLRIIMDSINNRAIQAPTQLTKPTDTSGKQPAARDTSLRPARRNPLRPD